MVDVFISYKREERARCARIHRKLKSLDLNVWFDAHLMPGMDFDVQLERALKSAKVVLVLWSPASVLSAWVREEASEGKARGVLAAIRLAPCDPPLGFGAIHYENLYDEEFPDDDAGWLKIVQRIAELTGRPALADYCKAISEAMAVMHRFAHQHPADPLAAKTNLFPSGAVYPAVPRSTFSFSATAEVQNGPASNWLAIENSLDIADYADFLDLFPHAEQAFQARLQKRRLESWATVNQTNPTDVRTFLTTDTFPALRSVAQASSDKLLASSERSRQLWVPSGTRAAEARVAALARRVPGSRRFAVELPDAPTWRSPVMVAIPPGSFRMGSPQDEERQGDYSGEEEPLHEVKIEHVFALGRSAVTLDAFAVFVAETGYDMGESAIALDGEKWGDTAGRGWLKPGFEQNGDHPVTCVSWIDAHAFIIWLNERLTLTGQPDAYRLPSEAEWEYSCRAQTDTPFSFGDRITTEQANFDGREGHGATPPSMGWRRATTPEGRFWPNSFGLYDMHGNTWDWCEDVWNPGYEGAPSDGTPWVTNENSLRVFRGGSWFGTAVRCRSAMRNRGAPYERYSGVGFRLARTLSAPAS